jgi:pSer/pThr/pTyr-binding forkhead associated (FHA) protein
MARLVVKFESQVLREVPIGARPLTIGRAPDNDLHIDNLAVSDHHARLYSEDGRMVIEDLHSLNGTYVNDLRVDRTTLRDGDTIQIGKYQLQLDTVHEIATTVADSVSGGRKLSLPNSSGTSAETDDPREPLSENAALSPGADVIEEPSADRQHAPVLRVLRGRTDRPEYVLSAKLTVIGSSQVAAVRLLGWFAPPIGAQINRHEDGYYLGLGDRVPKVNGQPVQGSTLLRDGDIIQVAGVRLQFTSPS